MSTYRNYTPWSARRESAAAGGPGGPASTPSAPVAAGQATAQTARSRLTSYRSGGGSASAAPSPTPTTRSSSLSLRTAASEAPAPPPQSPALSSVRERLAAAREKERKAEAEAAQARLRPSAPSRDADPDAPRFGRATRATSREPEAKAAGSVAAASKYGVYARTPASTATTARAEKKEPPPPPSRFAIKDSLREAKDAGSATTGRFAGSASAATSVDVKKDTTTTSTTTTTPATNRLYSEKKESTSNRLSSSSSAAVPTTDTKKEGSVLSKYLSGYRSQEQKTSRFLDKAKDRDRTATATAAYAAYRPTSLATYSSPRTYSSGLSTGLSSSVRSPTSTGPTSPAASTATTPTGSGPGSGPGSAPVARPSRAAASTLVFGKAEPAEATIPAWSDAEAKCIVWMTVVTRSTSPTAPSPSYYLRTRRADQARTTEREVRRPTSRPERFERTAQTDDMQTRWSRHAGPGAWTSADYRGTGAAGSAALLGYREPTVITPTSCKSPEAPQPTPALGKTDATPKDLRASPSPSPSPARGAAGAASTPSVPPRPASGDARAGSPAATKAPSPGKCVVKVIESGAVRQRVGAVGTAAGAAADADAGPGLVIKIPIKDFRKSALNVELSEDEAAEYKRQQAVQRRSVRRLAGQRSTSESSETPSDASPSVREPGPAPLPAASTTSAASPSPSVTPAPPATPPATPSSPADMTGVLQRPAATPSFQVGRSPEAEPDALADPWSSSSSSSESSSDEELQCNGLPPSAAGRLDKPPRPPSHSKAGTAGQPHHKSLLMRALGPVTNLFRHGSKTPTDAGGDALRDDAEDVFGELQRTKSSRSVGKASGDPDSASIKSGESVKAYKIRKQYSGERPWWLESTENIAEPAAAALQRAPSTRSLDKDSVKSFKIRKQYSGERPWWMDSADNIPAAGATVQRTPSSLSVNSSAASAASAPSSASAVAPSPTNGQPEERRSLAKLRPVESGERAWWLDSSESIPEGVERLHVADDVVGPQPGSPARSPARSPVRSLASTPVSASKASDSSERDEAKFRITRIFSGERPWWMFNSNPTELAPPAASLQQRRDPRDATASPSSSDEESSEDESRPRAPTPPRRHRPPPESDASSVTSDWLSDWPPPSPSPCLVPPPPPVRTSSMPQPQAQPQAQPPAPSTPRAHRPQRPRHLPLFIGGHTNIDDILGNVVPISPLHVGLSPDLDLDSLDLDSLDLNGDSSGSEQAREVAADQVRVHDSVAHTAVIEHRQQRLPPPTESPEQPQRPPVFQPPGMIKLDDAALQLYKDGDFGPYLDLDASIAEQQEDFEDFHTNRKNSLVLRTQLSVRVHTIIEKLVTSEGRELRRALFSLKQIFQEDKDLVHEFVQNEGLSCLVQVGSTADQKYQNYILRALGQVMLYVDGMNGVMEHPATLQWLYSLIASRFRLVVKTALKLLLVFIEYTDANSLLLIRAAHAVDSSEGLTPWSRIIRLLMDYDAADTELLIYAMTLLNKTLAGVPDQDTYYDQVDLLEEQGIESVITRYMSRQGTDLDLLRQLQIYEAVLQFEDGVGVGGVDRGGQSLRQLDDHLRKTLRNRKSLTSDLGMGVDRRRSRRHSTGTVPPHLRLTGPGVGGGAVSRREDGEDSSSSQSSQALDTMHLNGNYKESGGLTPALAQRLANGTSGVLCPGPCPGPDSNLLRAADRTPLLNAVNRMDNSWAYADGQDRGVDRGTDDLPDLRDLQARRENTVKDITQKLASQNILHSPVDENKSFLNDISGMAGIISKAKEGLAKSKSKQDVSPSTPPPPPPPSAPAPKIKSETELHWEELVSNLSRSLELCDLDFTDLHSDDEEDVLCPAGAANGVPPPPPPPVALVIGDAPPPPPPSNGRGPVGVASNGNGPTVHGPPVFGVSLQMRSKLGSSTTDGVVGVPPPPPPPPKKSKKTVKLFWKEVRDDPAAQAKTQSAAMIWDELRPVDVDTQKLEHLFESRAKDLISKKQQEMNKNKEIIVLDHKRSNAINIGMTKLPPPRSIKTAILKMDATVMNREGIEKLLTMLPTEDERTRIQEAQAAAPDTPLGSAEQFLLTLASISELPARLKLWAFKLDYENMEKEIAEPLMDLKQGMETLRSNKTFRCILQTLLSIGIFLNGSHVKGFQIEYLAKVPEVKDTVHKHSLLHHLCHMVMDKFPDSSDLYSEIGAVTRASKVDFDELSANIARMEAECKASWDRLKLVAKHDGSTMVKVKMSDFLADCAERIIVLSVVHRRVMNRYHRFLLWLGVPLARLPDTKPSEFCRIVSEFALEYRTTRERVLQQLQKKANHRERNKTRGKMITEVGKFQSKEVRADAELRQLLGSDISDVESIHGPISWGRRQRKDAGRSVLSPLSPLLRDDAGNGDNLTDGDDEILESLVKTATKMPSTRTVPRERKRTRHADRKSLRRTLKSGLSDEDRKHLAAYIKGY